MSILIKTLILINTPQIKPSQSSFLLGELLMLQQTSLSPLRGLLWEHPVHQAASLREGSWPRSTTSLTPGFQKHSPEWRQMDACPTSAADMELMLSQIESGHRQRLKGLWRSSGPSHFTDGETES